MGLDFVMVIVYNWIMRILFPARRNVMTTQEMRDAVARLRADGVPEDVLAPIVQDIRRIEAIAASMHKAQRVQVVRQPKHVLTDADKCVLREYQRVFDDLAQQRKEGVRA